MGLSWLAGDPVPGAPEWVRTPEWDFRVEWFHLRDAASDLYGRAWEDLNDVAGQNTYRSLDVDGHPDGPDGWSAREADDMIDRWLTHAFPTGLESAWERRRWEEENSPPMGVILWDMCRRKIIPPGRYLITKWW